MNDKPWVGKNILIIDDSRPVREALKMAFTSVGLRVVGVAENGIQGLKMVQEFQLDLVSLDIIMPEMDGVEFYRKAMELNPNLKCLVNSWLSSEAKVIAGLKDVMPAHIFQPKTAQGSVLESRLELLYFPNRAGRSMSAEDRDFNPMSMDINVKAS